MDITFDFLPQAVSQLYNKVENIERLLLGQRTEPQPEQDTWFNIVELSNYLPDRPSVPTLYGRVHFKQIPFHKSPGQKKLRFLKSEIDEWLKEGRKKTFAETEAEANQYINKKGLTNGR
jgi:hypothetical protein